MFKHAQKSVFLGFVLCMCFLGCSGGEYEPTSPSDTSNHPTINAGIPIGVTDWSPDGFPIEGTGILGLFDCHVSPERIAAEMTPIKTLASADVLEVVDISNFMQLNPCTDCVKIKSVSLDEDENLVLEIGIKHPYPKGNPNAPVSGRNRADLHVFNVEGIVFSNSETYYFPYLDEKIASPRLKNADGYTGYLDDVIDVIYPTDATIHPYITFFDDYSDGNYNSESETGFESVIDPPPSGHLVMPMGSDYDYKQYIFDINEPFEFLFAVGCSYGKSTENKPQRFNPVYRLPQFNKKSASKVEIQITYNALMEGIIDESNIAQFKVWAVDVNHNVPVGDNLDEMRCSSSVEKIILEIPDVTDRITDYDSGDISGVGHSPEDPLYTNSYPYIYNKLNASAGYHLGLVKVLDSYIPGLNESENIQGKDGIERVDPLQSPLTGAFLIDELATFQVFEIYVKPSEPCGPVTGTLIAPQCPVGPIGANQSVIFQFESSTSPNGGGTGYQIDFDYDGIEFHSDDYLEINDGDYYTFLPYQHFPNSCEEDIPYTFHMAFRVFDECQPVNREIFATCDVIVDECFDLKNIPLRDDAIPVDLSTYTSAFPGDLLILYDDGQVWKYYEATRWQQEDAGYQFTGYVNVNNKPEKICNNRIQISHSQGSDRVIASNADGLGPDGNMLSWPAQVFNADGSTVGMAPVPGTGGPVPDVLAYGDYCPIPGAMGILAHDNDTDEDSIYLASCGDIQCSWQKITPEPGLTNPIGFDKLYLPHVKGVLTRIYSIDNAEFWALEDAPDYYCARFGFDPEQLTYGYRGEYFGAGFQTDEDLGWYNAKDFTCESEGYIILDELSNGSGVMKMFANEDHEIIPKGHVDVPGDFSSNPIRIDISNFNVFVLHGDNENGYFLSVFDRDEFPWH